MITPVREWFSATPAHRRRITEADIHFCYTFFLKREPDPAGLDHYRERMRDGAPLEELIRGFAASDEFLMEVGTRPQDDVEDVSLGDYTVSVHRRDPDFGFHIHTFAAYEEHVRAALRAHLRPGDVFLDIGANVGVMALLAGTIVGLQGKVIAVEPDPVNLQMLYRGIVINNLANVEVWPFAASDTRAVVSLGGLSNAHIEAGDEHVPTSKLAQCVALDALLGRLPRLDCVKIDIEGHEPRAVAGLADNLAAHRPTLVVEWNPRTLKRANEDIDAFTETLLRIHPVLRAQSAFGDDHVVRSAGELSRLWETRDAELSASGQLPPGSFHFDLIGSAAFS